MAKPGVNFYLSEAQKDSAVVFVKEAGLFKKRLANFLKISRPTLDKVFEEDGEFFTRLEAADAEYCKELIMAVRKKDPVFILKTRYKDEFGDSDEQLKAKLFPYRD